MYLKILAVINFIVFSGVYSLQLSQVIILSRHNVRTPLAKNLALVTPKSWPHWKEKSGYLTQKGAQLEGFMGAFFSSWLKEEGLLPNHCPSDKDIFVYANVKQRTRASAQAFVDKGFPGCNVTVHHNDSDNDPIFNPVIHNTTETFKYLVIEEMEKRLKSLSLNNSYEEISNILDYEQSEFCRKEKQCDLLNDKNKIVDIMAGLKPNIKGPLKIGNSAIDAFIMEYYEGFKNVAWGMLDMNTRDWQTIMNLSRGYHNVIFNTTLVARDLSQPLIRYMTEQFIINKEAPKVVLLMGHDANLYTLLDNMNFEPYILEEQQELTPVGGKIVFQRWQDKETKKDYLKINYIYQSSFQLRNGIELSLASPPQFALLKLRGCDTNEDGFCNWEDFVKLLSAILL